MIPQDSLGIRPELELAGAAPQGLTEVVGPELELVDGGCTVLGVVCWIAAAVHTWAVASAMVAVVVGVWTWIGVY